MSISRRTNSSMTFLEITRLLSSWFEMIRGACQRQLLATIDTNSRALYSLSIQELDLVLRQIDHLSKASDVKLRERWFQFPPEFQDIVEAAERSEDSLREAKNSEEQRLVLIALLDACTTRLLLIESGAVPLEPGLQDFPKRVAKAITLFGDGH